MASDANAAATRRAQARRAMARAVAHTAFAAVCGIGAPAAAEDQAPPEAAEAAEAPAPDVVRTTSGYSVNVTDADLPRVLTALGQQAGFRVVDSGRVHPRVTVKLEDTPLDVTLRRLLRGANFMLVVRGGRRSAEIPASGIEEVILLSAAGEAPAAGRPGNTAASPLAGPGGAVVGAPPGGAQDPAGLQRAGMRPQGRGASPPRGVPPAGSMPPGALPPVEPPPPEPGEHIGFDPEPMPVDPALEATGGYVDPTAGNVPPDEDEHEQSTELDEE